MQDYIDRWEGGLKATGGAIRPDKTFAYPISFHWENSGASRYETVQEIDRTLTVKDHNNIRHELKQYDAHIGKDNLGVLLAPSGDMTSEIKHLSTKVQEWVSNVKAGYLPPHEVFDSISTTILKPLEYPLLALSLTKEECNKLVTPIYATALPKAKICRKFSRALVHGSKEVLGLDLPDIYVLQGIFKIAYFLENYQSSSLQGPLLRANLEWAQMEIGVGRNIFDLDFASFGELLPSTWIKSLWQFIDEYKISFPVHSEFLELHREHDVFLMEMFQRANFKPTDLVKLNRCCKFLQVVTLSDITDGSGNQISKTYWDGNKDNQRKSHYDWPEQSDPDAAHWALWRKALRKCFPTDNDKLLIDNLGAWTNKRRLECKWFYSPPTQRLFTKALTEGHWKVYKRVSPRGPVRKNNVFKYETLAMGLPDTAQRATVTKDQNNNHRFRITGWSPESDEDIPQPNTDASYKWMITGQSHRCNRQWIAQKLLQGNKLMAVSDGSFHPEYQVGSSSWVITEKSNTKRSIQGKNIIPGDKSVQCPHRSELGGLIGVIRDIDLLCKEYGITEGDVEVGCDGQQAYLVATRASYSPTTTISHFDISTTLHNLINNSVINWSFRHVKGHQDKILNIDKIDIWGRLNMIADVDAKVALWEHIVNQHPQPELRPLPNTLPAITINYNNEPTTICSKLIHNLKTHIATQTGMKYWKIKHPQIEDEDFDMSTFMHASKNVPTWQRRWLSKWSCGMCGVGRMLKRWKEQTHSKCPRCLTDNETVNHVIRCQHVDATLCWNTNLEDLREWMLTNHAIPGLAEAVLMRLTQWRDGNPFIDSPEWDDDVTEIINSQDHLGWDAACFGIISKQWSALQGQYLASLDRKTLGSTWVSRFIRQLWTVQHKMWLHRNTFVHGAGKSGHEMESEAVENAIWREFIIGRNGLLQEYLGLFRGTVQRILKQDTAVQQQWLSIVWAGRDRIRRSQNLDPWMRNPLAAAFISRFHLRRKRKKRLTG